jgi:hypothetical protein
MNGTEQRARHVAIRTAEKRLDDVETFLTALAAEIVKDREGYLRAVNEERTHRLKLADEQRAYVDREDRKQECALAAFKTMTFWQRLRWFVRGV